MVKNLKINGVGKRDRQIKTIVAQRDISVRFLDYRIFFHFDGARISVQLQWHQQQQVYL